MIVGAGLLCRLFHPGNGADSFHWSDQDPAKNHVGTGRE
jgi:hypothetical protein